MGFTEIPTAHVIKAFLRIRPRRADRDENGEKHALPVMSQTAEETPSFPRKRESKFCRPDF
jgi:hypothetical protein